MSRTIEQSHDYTVHPLADHLSFGVKVSGLDPAALHETALRDALHRLWIREGVIVFEALEGEEIHLELSSIFGGFVLHPAKEFNAVRPGIVNLEYRPEDGWLIDVDGEMRGQWLPWHSDLIYVDQINHGGILRPIQLPSRLGRTGFIDKIAAYESLPSDLKERIEDLNVVYQYDVNMENQRFGRKNEVKIVRLSPGIEKLIGRQHEFPSVMHPMVYTQEDTNRKVLNVSPWFAMGIKEMPDAAGDALLAEVVDHLLDDDGAYFHNWSMGEMVLWDNWRTLHCAEGAPADEVRFLQRTTIAGDYGLGRVLDGEMVDRSQYISL